MSDITETKVFYALREKQAPHRMVHINIRYNGDDAECCNSHQVTLTFDDWEPLYRAETARIAARVLVCDIPWYNTDEERPSWGSVKPETLEVVKIEQVVRTTTTKVEIEKPLLLNVFDSRDSTRKKCSELLQKELPDNKKLGHWAIRIVELPDDETLQSLNGKCDNKYVMFGKGTSIEHYCWGAFALPADSTSLKTEKTIVGVVTSGYAPE